MDGKRIDKVLATPIVTPEKTPCDDSSSAAEPDGHHRSGDDDPREPGERTE